MIHDTFKTQHAFVALRTNQSDATNHFYPKSNPKNKNGAKFRLRTLIFQMQNGKVSIKNVFAS